MNNQRVLGVIGFSFLGLSMAACNGAAPESMEAAHEADHVHAENLSEVTVENEETLNPIARVDVKDVGSVRFYEPAPGVILIGSGGHADIPLLLDMEGMSAIEKYEHLANSPAPQALIDAAARAERLANEARESDASGEADMSSEAAPMSSGSPDFHEKSHGTDFQDANCDLHNISSADHRADWVSVTGTGSFTWTKLDWVESAAQSRQGTIRFRARVKDCLLCSWGSYSSVNLSAGQGWMWSYSKGANFQFNAIVDQADGDHYDFCSEGMN